jgi:hypothetical protein
MNIIEEHQRVWEERWQAVIDGSPMRRRRQQQGTSMQRWNNMAEDFAKRTADKENEEK